DLWKFRADRLRGIETLGGVGGRHADVQHDELWEVLAHQPHQLGHVARLADELKARTLEQAGDALTYEQIVIRDHETDRSHGRQASLCHRMTGGPAVPGARSAGSANVGHPGRQEMTSSVTGSR